MEIKSACGFDQVFDGSVRFLNLEYVVFGTVKSKRKFVFDLSQQEYICYAVWMIPYHSISVQLTLFVCCAIPPLQCIHRVVLAVHMLCKT